MDVLMMVENVSGENIEGVFIVVMVVLMFLLVFF